jgi:hypothetical protein
VKQGRIGSKSEGPDYYLQTLKEDFLLWYEERALWKPDYYIEFYNRKIVTVNGMLEKETNTIKINQDGIKLLPVEVFPKD